MVAKLRRNVCQIMCLLAFLDVQQFRPEHLRLEVVIVVVPIVLRMPAVFVFIPPSVPCAPAVLPLFVKFMTPMFGLLAAIAMMLNGFVQVVFYVGDAPLAIVVSGVQSRHPGEHEKAGQRCYGKRRFPEQRIVQPMSHSS